MSPLPTGPWGADPDHLTRAWVASALLMVACFVVTAPALLVDERTLDGVPIFAEPLEFAASLALHFVTLALLAQQLPRRVRAGGVLALFGYLAIVA